VNRICSHFFSVRYIIVFYFIFIQLLGCSANNHSPAPVTSVEGYKAEIKLSINTSTYRIRKGETLYAIAWRTNQDFKYLAALNQIKDPYQIFPGQVLTLKGKIPKPKPKQHKSTVKHKSVHLAKNVKLSSGQTTGVMPLRHVAKPQKSAYSKTTVAKVNPAAVQVKPVAKKAKPTTKQIKSEKRRLGVSNKNLTWHWPAAGNIVNAYSSTQLSHKGLNIAGKLGRSVTAAESGRVVYSGNGLRGYGNLIIIKHNDDYLSAYAYNKTLLVKEQQWVKAGQKIASMGSSGPNSGAELYFEIRYRGKPVNPMRYLPKR
jgi:lipoprotein NlpD